jgi:D-beta-D-heptose 7-phosphate kinase/D-beta-D-heptose 1-phosphate adenosyltransferase
VDLVTTFEEDTPLELLTELIPDVLVKGGDYKEADVVGGEVVREHGGKVEILAFKEGFSTTAIEEKILQLRNTRTT